MRTRIPPVLLLLFLTLPVQPTLAQGFYRIPLRFAACPVPAAPDYRDTQNWASLPWINDPADNAPKGLKNAQDSATCDVFFIHPTSFLQKTNDQYQWNASISNAAVNKETDNKSMYYQASVFNASCRIFAPRYRQAHYYSFFSPYPEDKDSALSLAYRDVAAAFRHYVQYWNNGRPFIIAAHSQGSLHAQKLLNEIAQNPALKRNMVVAYIPGMPARLSGISGFTPCADSAQTQCWCSWRTFRTGFEPMWKEDSGMVVTNPINWKTDGSYAPAVMHKGAVLTDFRKIRRGICDAQKHNNVLWIHRPRFPGSFLITDPNYHAGDFNLFYMDVRENIRLRMLKHTQGNRVSE